jgi:5-methylcytosine-specific restriction enzyme subunit McrC
MLDPLIIPPISEHDSAVIQLADDDISFLQQFVPGKLNIYPTGEQNRYLIKTGSNVGFIILPSKRVLEIRPKVPVNSLFSMLAKVYDPARRDIFRDNAQSYATMQDLFEYVVRIFTIESEDVLTAGLLKSYQKKTDVLTTVKGRLRLEETWHRFQGLQDQHVCCFSNFTPDVTENRAIRFASHLLKQIRYKQKDLSSRLQRIDQALHAVQYSENILEKLDGLDFNRLNERYRPALLLAKLLIDHLTFSGSSGDEPFLSYLIDMDWLFQAYLAQTLKDYARRFNWTVMTTPRHYLDMEKSIAVEPDILLIVNLKPVLIVDAKYKLSASQEDIYQMIAYCHALDLQKAILVHPAHEKAPMGERFIRGPGNICIEYQNLAVDGSPYQLQDAAAALAVKVNHALSEVLKVKMSVPA